MKAREKGEDAYEAKADEGCSNRIECNLFSYNLAVGPRAAAEAAATRQEPDTENEAGHEGASIAGVAQLYPRKWPPETRPLLEGGTGN